MEKSNGSKVCVTGGAGFIGSLLVKKLLEKGYTVHATLRNLDDVSKVSLLRNLPDSDKRLVLFEADIYNPVTFEQAIEGCEFVFHVATPFTHTPNSQDYTVSKTLAEREILSHGNHNKRSGLEIVSLTCGLVGGNSLLQFTPETVTWLVSYFKSGAMEYSCMTFLEELVGKIPIVHIDDVCDAHIFCMESPSINGRFLCARSYVSSAHIASYYRQHYPELEVKQECLDLPNRQIGWGGTKLTEEGFVYKYDTNMILDDCITCARKWGSL